MKVIFLDIDGVMNYELFYRKRHKKLNNRLSRIYYRTKSKIRFVFNGFKHKYTSLADWKPNPKHDTFEYKLKRLKFETCLERWEWLSEFCNKNNYKICISSVWKGHFNNYIEWNKALIALGFNDGTYVGRTGNRQTLRGSEIKNWINFNGTVEKYAIIDDDSDMLKEQFKNFFFVDRYSGLTPNTLYRIEKHMKGECEYEHLNKQYMEMYKLNKN